MLVAELIKHTPEGLEERAVLEELHKEVRGGFVLHDFPSCCACVCSSAIDLVANAASTPSDRGRVRQVQGHCEYVDRNAKLDDGRAKCGEIHQQFRLKDMMDDKHIGDLRALENIQGLPEHPNTGLCLAFRRLVLEAEASDLLSGSECRVLLFNDMVRHLSAGRDSATSLFGI